MPAGQQTIVAPSVVRSGPSARPAAAAKARRRLQPGWPLAALFVGYPLWWILGVAELVSLGAALVMAFELLRRRHIAAPRGFGWWWLFLAWVIVGVAVLQVDAPGAVAGDSSNRYLVWAYRLAWYAGATVVMLYVGNMRVQLSTRRVTRILAWMFVWIVAGGLLGTLAPTLEFPSLLELVLPQSLVSNGFVNAQVHPTLAQWGGVLGYQTGRPSAPFTYANTWGLNFACFLPFFLSAWFGRAAGWRRAAAPVILIASLIPVIHSLNRGLWFALVVSAAFVAARSAMTGRLRLLGALLCTAAVVAVVVLSSPLGATIEARLSNPGSQQGRTNLGSLGLLSMIDKSPVVGFGTTRNVQGTFGSIAGGDTANCPRCSPPALGTQGQFSLVSFSQGLGGLTLYLGFFGLILLRHIRLRSEHATLGLTVILVHLVTLPVYGAVGVALFPIMIAVALLWREASDPPATAANLVRRRTVPTEPTLGGYLGLLRRHAALIGGLAVAGTVAGGAWQASQSTSFTSSVSILLPEEPMYPGLSSRPLTLDTLGQIASGAVVRDSLEETMRRSGQQPGAALSVTATPNSRILHLGYTAGSAAAATKAVTAAARELVAERTTELEARQRALLGALQSQSDALSSSVKTLEDASAHLQAGAPPSAPYSDSQLLRERRYQLLVESGRVSTRIAQVSSLHVAPGHILNSATARPLKDGWRVSPVSGLMLGLTGGLLLGLLRDAVSGRLRRRETAMDLTGLRVLAELPADAFTGGATGLAAASEEVTRVVYLYRPTGCVSADDDPSSRALATRLDTTINRVPTKPRSQAWTGGPARDQGRQPGTLGTERVLIVASRRTRSRIVLHLRDTLEGSGVSVAGLILVAGRKSIVTRIREATARGR